MACQAWLGRHEAETAFPEHQRPITVNSGGVNVIVAGQRALTLSGLPCQGAIDGSSA